MRVEMGGEIDLSLLGPGDRFVLDRLREKGRAWIVGGWVRDLISGYEPNDIDVATDLLPKEVQAIFPKSIMVGEKFGTTIVRLENMEGHGYQCEVTTLRQDGGYADGRRPDNVIFGTEILVDLDRRDFTINAMAIEPTGILMENDNPIGKLIDRDNRGINDLKNAIVRAVGNPGKRLGEDGLRVIRAFRFLSKEDGGLRKLEPELGEAILSNRKMLGKISKERIWTEIRSILSMKNSKDIVRMMDEYRLFEEITPGLSINHDAIHSNDHLVNLALIYSSENFSGVELSEKLGGNLRLSNFEKGEISFLHGLKGLQLNHSSGSIRRFKATIEESRKKRVFQYLSGRGIGTEKFQEVCRNLGEEKTGRLPLIDGNMLCDLTGLIPGKKLGRLKEWLYTIQVERGIESKEEMIVILEEIGWEDSEYEAWPILSWP